MNKVKEHWNGISSAYNKWGNELPRYLVISGYLHVLLALRKNIKNFKKTKVLDYGCGAGKANIFFNLYFDRKNVTGVDISEKMIEEASEKDPEGTYKIINQDGSLPVNQKFDCAMSNWVLLTIDTADKMVAVIREVHKLLKPNGVFAALVNNEDSLGIQTPIWKNGDKNTIYKSGNRIIVTLFNEKGDDQVHLNDYYWTKEDYCTAFVKAGFKKVESYIPVYDSQEAKREIEYLNLIGFLSEDVDYKGLVKDKPTRIIIGEK